MAEDIKYFILYSLLICVLGNKTNAEGGIREYLTARYTKT